MEHFGEGARNDAAPDPTLAAGRPSHARLQMLDGWRAISILAVIAAHMLPVGPKSWALNEPVAALGMAIFFTLSGFLVVSILQRDRDVIGFAIKRVARILPLAWGVLIPIFVVAGASGGEWRANLLFYANLPPFYLMHLGHFWSLSLEMQFYAAIGLIVAAAGARGLWIVPVAALTITLVRIIGDAPISIVTWLRIDEILAGGTLALLLHERTDATRRWLGSIPFLPVAFLFLLSAGGASRCYWLNFLRPYLTATMVGITIVRPVRGLSGLLTSRVAGYVASISYALYIIHPLTMHGWLGAGAGWEKYAKRPISFALTWAAAHLSTFRFEQPVNRWAHRLAASSSRKRRAAAIDAGRGQPNSGRTL